MNKPKPILPAALMGRSAFTRRSMIRGAGLAGTAAFLAACGIQGTDDATSGDDAAAGDTAAADAPAEDLSDTEKKLVWSNWPEYLDVDDDNPSVNPTLDRFREETGIDVTYIEDVNDNDQYFAKVQPQLAAGQTIAADTFIVTDWMVAKLIRLGYLQEIDHGNIPNIKNLNPELKDVGFDPGRKMSITWQSGFAGISYNPDVTGKPVETIDQLLTDPDLKGKVTLLTEMRDTMGLVLLDMGYDCSDFTDEQFMKAIEKVQAAVDSGQIRAFFGNDYAQGLVNGDIAACMAWTGDVVQLQPDNPNLQYVLPEAGAPLWSDNFVIPKGAKHKKNAELLINYYYQPDVAAEVADWVNYISPVEGAKEALLEADPEVADNPLIFPSEEIMSRAQVFMPLDEDQEERYSAAFAKLMGA